MAAWNWVLELFQSIVLQKKFLTSAEYWFVEYGTSESSEWYQTDLDDDMEVTKPKRIYNSHYRNGVPAMFTSECCPAEK